MLAVVPDIDPDTAPSIGTPVREEPVMRPPSDDPFWVKVKVIDPPGKPVFVKLPLQLPATWEG
jgi:hypothetical protein